MSDYAYTADTFPFPEGAVVRTPGGLMRADLSTDRTCGCGQPAVAVLIIARIKGRSGARTCKTSRVPLCTRHDAASTEQAARRNAARASAWNVRDAAIKAACRAQQEYASRPVIGFTLVAGQPDGIWELFATAGED